MGNCCDRCLGRSDKRKYLRTRYNVERDFSIEFENLMDDDQPVPGDQKCQLQLGGPFTVSSYMRWLVKQEEELRMEEDAYYDGGNELLQTTRLHSKREHNKKLLTRTKRLARKVDPDDESDLLGEYGDEEFEKFLESVHERSLAARTRMLSNTVPLDAASETSSRDQEECSKTEMSSIDLEWEHEAGMALTGGAKAVKEPFVELAVKGVGSGDDNLSNDYEWDNDFASGENTESDTLLARTYPESVER